MKLPSFFGGFQSNSTFYKSKITRENIFNGYDFDIESNYDTVKDKNLVLGISADLLPVLYPLDREISVFMLFMHFLVISIFKSLPVNSGSSLHFTLNFE